MAEVAGRYAAREAPKPYGLIHAVVLRDGEMYVAECLEIAVVTQARTLDELVGNLEEAVNLHLEGEIPSSDRSQEAPRLSVILEVPLRMHARKT